MPRSMKTTRKIAGLALAALVVTACSKTETEPAKTAQVPAVAVAKAAVEDLASNLLLTAELRPYQEIDVMAKVAGYVKSIHVDIGDRVKKGQQLAVLEVPEMADDLARASSSLKGSEAEAAKHRDELRRAQSLYDIAQLSYTRLAEVAAKRPGLIAQQEIDDARSKALATEAQVAAAKSSLEAANEQVLVNRAGLARIKTMIDYTRVTAPFSGVITKRYANTGSMIQAGIASQTQAMPLVRLAEDTTLRIIVPVPESAVPSVRVGQQVEVRVPTLNRSFAGKVTRFASSVAASTRTMDTEVDVPNSNLALVPGMYAEVRLNLAQRKGVMAIPVTAVDITGNGAAPKEAGGGAAVRTGRVLVVAPGNRIEVRQVSLGLETASKTEVLSGLKEGDLVVVGSRAGLQAGQEVQPKVTSLGETPSKNGK